MFKKRSRVVRREAEREALKLAEARERLARLEPGGSPERPLLAESASVVEARALSLGCARCGGETRIDEHAAKDGLRVVRVRCKACGVRRVVYVQLEQRLAN